RGPLASGISMPAILGFTPGARKIMATHPQRSRLGMLRRIGHSIRAPSHAALLSPASGLKTDSFAWEPGAYTRRLLTAARCAG
ncbi:MAG: hypothetical protein WD278_18020, partial [Pirellulales bacterium]